MSVTLTFTPPGAYNLSFYEIGQAEDTSSALTVVASGTDIGSFPDWVSQINYSGDNTFWYAVRFGTDDGGYTAWSDRMYGRYGSNLGYFLLNPSGSQWVYLIPPQSSGIVPNWLEYNYEYTVTIDSSGLYGVDSTYMEEDYSLVFSVLLCPLWSTVESVRLVVGPLADGIPDDTINKMILKVSLQAMTRFFGGVNNFGCTYTDVPEPVYRWVTCMAGMLALNASISSGSGSGNTKKQLGALSISYDGGANDGTTPADIRKSLQDCIDESAISIGAWFDTLAVSAIKAYTNTYITHPMADTQWGRHPRKVDEDIQGPWLRAFNDIQLYQSDYMLGGDVITSYGN